MEIIIIGDRLADLRKDAGLDQVELAEKLGLTYHTISSYEREKSTPDDDMKVKIAELFNVSLDFLLGLIDSPLSYERDVNCIYLPDNMPEEGRKEIADYIELIKMKYKL